MMKRNLTYSLVLGATLALSFCQGRQNGVYDPMQGQNARNVQAIINTPVESRALPESLRSQRYSLSYTTDQYNACIATLKETQAASSFCTQIIYDSYYKMFGPGFESFVPDNTQMIAGDGSTFDLDWRGMFNNQAFVPQYQNWMGGMDPNAQGAFRTAYPMQSFCGDSTQFTTIQFRGGACTTLNSNYLTIPVNSNTGMNYMRRGEIAQAAPFFQPGGWMSIHAPRTYGTVLSRRNVGKENEALTKEVNASWSNFKQLPKGWGLLLANRALDTVASIPTAAVENVNAQMAAIGARNYSQAAQSRQIANYYDQYASQYLAAQEMSQISTVEALEPVKRCPQGKYVYTVGPQPSNDGEYRVLDCEGS